MRISGYQPLLNFLSRQCLRAKPTVPDTRDENIRRLRQNGITHDRAGRAESDHDLADAGILGRHAQGGKIQQLVDRRPDQRQSPSRGARVSLIEESP
jgi:hypothetical protein